MLKVDIAAIETEGLLIKTWEFTGAGTANVTINNVVYEYQNTLDDPTRNPNSPLYPEGVASFTRKTADGVWEYYWGATIEVADKPGLPGQNTANPKSHFGDHRIVKIDGKYYDPSYGTQFATLQAWEDASVMGFYTIGELPDNNVRLVFRKNPVGLNIKTNPPNS